MADASYGLVFCFAQHGRQNAIGHRRDGKAYAISLAHVLVFMIVVNDYAQFFISRFHTAISGGPSTILPGLAVQEDTNLNGQFKTIWESGRLRISNLNF